MSHNYQFRIIFVGEAGVGKTTLLSNLNNKPPPVSHQPTIGVDFATAITTLPNAVIKSYIWDTAGQEYFFSITKQYFQDIAGAIIVFDLSNAKTFHKVKYWFDELKKVNKYPFKVLLVGNKNDLVPAVTYEEVSEFARKYKMNYCETCGLDNKFFSFENFIQKIYYAMPPTLEKGMGIRRFIHNISPPMIAKPPPPKNECCHIL